MARPTSLKIRDDVSIVGISFNDQRRRLAIGKFTLLVHCFGVVARCVLFQMRAYYTHSRAVRAFDCSIFTNLTFSPFKPKHRN